LSTSESSGYKKKIDCLSATAAGAKTKSDPPIAADELVDALDGNVEALTEDDPD
jgi:hypothetical protein